MFIGSFNPETRPSINDTTCTPQWDGNLLCDNQVTLYQHDELKIAFHGEIYNKKQIGAESTASNAQAVATLYKQHGTSIFGRLDGSFSIIIVDGDCTMVIRDHHGTDSQIYYNDSYYASSLELLRQTPGCSAQVNRRALGTFLAGGYIPTGESSFTKITKLAAGSMLVYRNGKITCLNLFETSHIMPVAASPYSLEQLSERYAELHHQAIKRRIAESRNVGILLSGGYDSGCNLAALRDIYDGDIHSFSIGFKGDNWSELPLAQCMSERYGTIHNQYEIDGSEISALPEIVRYLGDPFVEGGLMVNYAAMRMIGNSKPDIILGGDGSDQYFGTTAREVAIHYLATRSGLKPALNAIHSLLSGEAFDTNNTPYRIRFHLTKILNIHDGDIFGFEPFKLKKLLKYGDSMPKTEKIKSDCRSFEHLYTQHAYISDIEKIINQVILFKASRMAQMFGNKIAFPYMDLELYDFLQQLPVGFKCKGENALRIAKGECTAKFLLKHHYKSLLPEQITCKKKQGGFAPMPIFFKDKAQRARIAEMILSSSATDEFLNRQYVEQFIKRYDAECDYDGAWFWYKQNRAIQYFNLLTLAIWWEQNIGSNRSIAL